MIRSNNSRISFQAKDHGLLSKDSLRVSVNKKSNVMNAKSPVSIPSVLATTRKRDISILFLIMKTTKGNIKITGVT